MHSYLPSEDNSWSKSAISNIDIRTVSHHIETIHLICTANQLAMRTSHWWRYGQLWIYSKHYYSVLISKFDHISSLFSPLRLRKQTKIFKFAPSSNENKVDVLDIKHLFA